MKILPSGSPGTDTRASAEALAAELAVEAKPFLNVDPFTNSSGDEFPVTLRDFLAAYEHAVK